MNNDVSSTQKTRSVAKLVAGVLLAVLTLATPMAASAGSMPQSINSGSGSVNSYGPNGYMTARVSWGGCGGCTQ